VIARLGALTVAAAAAAALAGAASPPKSCVVSSALTLYETPSLQIHEHRVNGEHVQTIVCIRATGRGRVVDTSTENGFGETDIDVNRVLDNRYVWLQEQSTAAATLDNTNDDRLVDLTTGRAVGATTFDSDTDGNGTSAFESAVAVPGALITSDGSTVDARIVATHKLTTLDPDTDDATTHELAASDHVVYWLHGTTTMSAAAPGGAARAAKAPRGGICERAHTSTLLRADGGGVRVSRTHGPQAVTACLRSTGDRWVMTEVLKGVHGTGAPTQIDDLAGATSSGLDDAADIRYAFPATAASGPVTAIVILNVHTGPLLSALAPARTTDWVAGETPAVGVRSKLTDVIAYTDGTTVTMVDHFRKRVVATGTNITDLALSPDLSDQVNDNTERTGRLYWTAAGGPASVAVGMAPAR
jgi:hypothetical protein